MAKSAAATVPEYLAELPEERRAVISALRDVVRENLPPGYEETMNWGMICYEIPLSRYPDTYNKQPLAVAAVAAQKNYYAVYLHSVYGHPEHEARLREGFARAGKKLDMGKSCVRFRKLDDVPLDVLADAVTVTTPEELIAHYERSRGIA